jgi:hypothetical protein
MLSEKWKWNYSKIETKENKNEYTEAKRPTAKVERNSAALE